MRFIKVALVLVMSASLSGCMVADWFTRTEFVHAKRPLIEAPERPTLDSVPPTTDEEKAYAEKILPNVTKLQTYSRQLEAAVKTYNEEAERYNKEHEEKKDDE